MTAAAQPLASVAPVAVAHRRPRRRGRRLLLHAFLIGMCALWLFPLLWAVYTSLRPYADTSSNAYGYISIGGHYNLDNFVDAWDRAEPVRSTT